MLHKHILAVLKVATNADTTVENAYTIKSAQKCETAKKNWLTDRSGQLETPRKQLSFASEQAMKHHDWSE